MKNSFTISRFWNYTKAEFISSKRGVLIFLLAIIGAVISMQLIGHFTFVYTMRDFGELSYYYHDNSLEFARVTGLMIISISTLVYVSKSFKTFYNKGLADSAIMLPVSKGEKFTHALLQHVVVIPLILVMFFLLSDSLWSTYYKADSFLSEMFEVFGNGQYYTEAIVFFISSIILNMMIFFFGAILFRRNHFIYTVFAIFGIQLILYLMMIIVFDIEIVINALSEVENSVLTWSFVALELAISAVLLILSWTRFRKLEIAK